MALLEDALGGWGGGLAIGVGVAFVAPPLVTVAGSILVPVARLAMRGALAVVDTVGTVSGAAVEQVSNFAAEVRAETAQAKHRARPTAVHH